ANFRYTIYFVPHGPLWLGAPCLSESNTVIPPVKSTSFNSPPCGINSLPSGIQFHCQMFNCDANCTGFNSSGLLADATPRLKTYLLSVAAIIFPSAETLGWRYVFVSVV